MNILVHYLICGFAPGKSLLQKFKEASKAVPKHAGAFEELCSSFDEAQVKVYMLEIERWQEKARWHDESEIEPDPFREVDSGELRNRHDREDAQCTLQFSGSSLINIRAQLAKEERDADEAGLQPSLHEVTESGFLVQALEIEEQQYVLIQSGCKIY
jgi:hypothetical protein